MAPPPQSRSSRQPPADRRCQFAVRPRSRQTPLGILWRRMSPLIVLCTGTVHDPLCQQLSPVAGQSVHREKGCGWIEPFHLPGHDFQFGLGRPYQFSLAQQSPPASTWGPAFPERGSWRCSPAHSRPPSAGWRGEHRWHSPAVSRNSRSHLTRSVQFQSSGRLDTRK